VDTFRFTNSADMVIVHTFIKALTRAGRFIAQLEYFMDLIGDNLLFFPNEIPTYRTGLYKDRQQYIPKAPFGMVLDGA
jgi:hypothetical protein